MASRESTVAFIAEQVAGAGAVSARKMFGEYAIFCDGKVVALICDDQLFIKPTGAGRAHIGDVTQAAPYKGANPAFSLRGIIGTTAIGSPRSSASRLRNFRVLISRDARGDPGSIEAPKPDPGPARPHPRTASIRPVAIADVPALKALIDATGLFPPDMLDDMLAPSFGPEPDDRQVWLTDAEGALVSVAYYAPERMTDGTWTFT